ncbi:MAG: hypothetical protein JF602_01245, partial [Gemmatimonadetes bacterium]|nr:hypothetical protein [Gemmatimonadota bacterium]
MLVAGGSLAALAIACEQRSPIRDRTAMAAVASAPPPIAPQNEPAGAAPARALLTLNKVAADEKQLASEQPEAAFAVTGTGAAMPAASAVSSTTSAGAMVIRTGTAGIEVDSLDTAIARVRTLALRVNGFVANTAVQGGRDQLRSASLELKI